MITEKEIEAVKLSATKKDFYQIWNELIDTACKLSERWDPSSTNESDPGIVLLKVLTAVADKLNYTIDKNTLEDYMPSAAQEESMRKLCDMMGYSMKYYQSATTDVTFKYTGTDSLSGTIVKIPKYTCIKDTDEEINYFTLEQVQFGGDDALNSASVECMEGELLQCADDTDGIISMSMLDDDYRYYLPEEQVAENGCFVTNYADGVENEELWECVDNLNTQEEGKKCYKFGYDYIEGLPYLQFPDDVSSIIEDGLCIRYTRTNGANGNISARTLSTFTEPSEWSDEDSSDLLVKDNFTVTNPSATANGSDKATLNDAYNGYKKTVGTFDTLVTCRDYINKIYTLTEDSANQTPLVSNVVVSDIRDDINRAVTLCTFNEYGICYKDMSLIDDFDEDRITRFDLVLYPFKTITGTVSASAYRNSFKYSAENVNEICSDIAEQKTLAHNIVSPNNDEIACVKNYLKLKATIFTTKKINSIEEAAILSNVYQAIYTNFNARKLDFGEEIPNDTIRSVIANADTRIKNVDFNDTDLCYTKVCLVNGDEYDTAAYINKLVLRNVLAGRISLFEYDESFKPDYADKEYGHDYKPTYGRTDDDAYIGKLTSSLEIGTGADKTIDPVKLQSNEVIQFRAPNFTTTKTLSAYINYFLHLNDDSKTGTKPTPATFQTLGTFMTTERWTEFVNDSGKDYMESHTIDSSTAFASYETKYGALFTAETKKDGEGKDVVTYTRVISYSKDFEAYYFCFNDGSYNKLYSYVASQTINSVKLSGLYRSLGADLTRNVGKMVDENKIKYIGCYKYIVYTYPMSNYFVQVTHERTEQGLYTADGFGADGTNMGIQEDQIYQLKSGEWLAINYTPSTTDDEGNSTSGTPVNEVYVAGQTIKPNFDLLDSSTYHSEGHTAPKTTGYTFIDGDYHGQTCQVKTEIGNVGGMYTMGSSEQIELMDTAVVELDDSICNIYFERKDEDQLTVVNDEYIEFAFDEDPATKGGTDYMSYTLKDGEYFYYTDSSKLDLAYYGSGTKITKNTNTPRLLKQKSTTSLADDIANDGLLAALPWYKVNLSGDDKKLELLEYQYVNLVEDDTLVSFNNGGNDGISGEIKTGDWVETTSAVYRLSDDESDTTLPAITDGEGNSLWKATAILNMNVAPAVTQTLHRTDTTIDSITAHYYKMTSAEEEYEDHTEVFKPAESDDGGYVDLSLKTNYQVQTSSGTADTHIYSYDADGNIDEYVNDFAIKVFFEDVISGTRTSDTTVSDTLNIGNFGDDGMTKVSFSSDNLTDFTLNAVVPTTDHALLMIYCTDPESQIGWTDDNNHGVYITLEDGSTVTPAICNNGGWWKDDSKSKKSYIHDNQYYLKPNAINVIELSGSCVITVHADSQTVTATDGNTQTKSNASVIFSPMDYVAYSDEELALNPKLCYQASSGTAGEDAYTQIMSDINAADPDHNFYYNALIDSSLTIDLNEYDDEEDMLSLKALFSSNNVNSKFTIQEIDQSSLSTGIKIASACKR